MSKPFISIIVGSKNDVPKLVDHLKILTLAKAHWEISVFSCHRNFEELKQYIDKISQKNCTCILAAAGLTAALPGDIAKLPAAKKIPVIGIPLDEIALTTMLYFPRGTPVATVAPNNHGIINALLLALQITSQTDKEITFEKITEQFFTKPAHEAFSTHRTSPNHYGKI